MAELELKLNTAVLPRNHVIKIKEIVTKIVNVEVLLFAEEIIVGRRSLVCGNMLIVAQRKQGVSNLHFVQMNKSFETLYMN